MENTYLAVILEPLGSNARDAVVDLLGALRALQSGGALALHGFEQLLVDRLLQVASFL